MKTQFTPNSTNLTPANRAPPLDVLTLQNDKAPCKPYESKAQNAARRDSDSRLNRSAHLFGPLVDKHVNVCGDSKPAKLSIAVSFRLDLVTATGLRSKN